MSRSRKDAVGGHNPHPTGYEWWSRRPLSRRCGAFPDKQTKVMTHRRERCEAKQAMRRDEEQENKDA